MNCFGEPLSRLLPSYVYLAYLIGIFCLPLVHAEFSVIVRCLFIFGASSWLIFFMFVCKSFGVCRTTIVRSWTLGVALLFLYIGFWLDLIKISLQEFGCVSSVFTVVLGRYRLQRLNYSDAECSFHTSLGLRTLNQGIFVRSFFVDKY